MLQKETRALVLSDAYTDITPVRLDRHTISEKVRPLLLALDNHLENASPPLGLAHYYLYAGGEVEHYGSAYHIYLTQMTIDKPIRDRLEDIAKGCEDKALGYWAKRLHWFYHGLEDAEQYGMIESSLNVWRGARSQLYFLDRRELRGEEDLTEAIANEHDVVTRQAIYEALHEKDNDLVRAQVELRDKRNSLAKSEGYPDFFTYSMHDAYALAEGEISEIRYRLHQPLYNAFKFRTTDILNFAGQTQISVPDYFYYSTQSDRAALKQLAPSRQWESSKMFGYAMQMLGLSQYLTSLKIDRHVTAGRQRSRLCAIEPPWLVISLVRDKEEDFSQFMEVFEELGHGIHFVTFDGFMPFAFRKRGSPDHAWIEAIGGLFVSLLSEVMKESSYVGENSIGKLVRQARLRRFASLAICELYTQFEEFFYGREGIDEESVSQKWLELFNELFPQITTRTPLGWANDMYLGEYPVYCANYLIADVISAQLRSFGQKHFGSLLSPEFGHWLRESCLKPGFSRPWPELLISATGEQLNPEYLHKEIDETLSQT